MAGMTDYSRFDKINYDDSDDDADNDKNEAPPMRIQKQVSLYQEEDCHFYGKLLCAQTLSLHDSSAAGGWCEDRRGAGATSTSQNDSKRI